MKNLKGFFALILISISISALSVLINSCQSETDESTMTSQQMACNFMQKHKKL